MKTALILFSKHTKKYAAKLATKYNKPKLYKIVHPPTKTTEKISKKFTNFDIVIGIGGGSVIDTAKLFARNKRCIAIPTTASGAASTPYATIWTKNKKISIPTLRPITKKYKENICLPKSVIKSTLADVLSHIIESLWSKNRTIVSIFYCCVAISKMNEYFTTDNINYLIDAGNWAGKAITITKTNIVHAISYPITLKYGINHGTACGILLPYLVEYMQDAILPILFGLASTKDLINFLKKKLGKKVIRNFNAKIIASEALKYKKINVAFRTINKKDLINILLKIQRRKR